MPTNRTKRTRKSKPKNLPDNIRLLLETGSGPTGNAETFLMEGSDQRMQAVWEQFKNEIMAAWIREHPGSRPWAWWEIDAPEPRRRVGGTGTPDFEVLAYTPHYERGVPTGWITQDDVDIYGPNFKGIPVDPYNPPQFESEAAFLKRHNLLSITEIKHLDKNPKLLKFDIVIA